MPIDTRTVRTSPTAIVVSYARWCDMSWKSHLARLVVAVLILILSVLAGSAPGAEQAIPQSCTPCLTPDVPPPKACVKMRRGDHLCSGTVVAQSANESLILCCNHCFADKPWPGGRIPKGKYPADCTIERLSDGKQWPAVAVDGSPEVDCALIVVRATITDAAPAVSAARRGDACEHWGISSEHTTGRVLGYNTGDGVTPNMSEWSTLRSIPGDSGAGVWSGGRLVAVNRGYDGLRQQRGTAIVFHLRFARGSKALGSIHPDLAKALPRDPDLPAVPSAPPTLPGPGVNPPCPDGNCPLPSPWHRPRLLPWRR